MVFKKTNDVQSLVFLKLDGDGFISLVLPVCEQVGGEGEEENQEAEEESGDGKEENAEEEGVVVDADSTDSAVLVNGNESEEQWGMYDK